MIVKDGEWILVENQKAMTHISTYLLYILYLIIPIPPLFVDLILLFCVLFLAGH